MIPLSRVRLPHLFLLLQFTFSYSNQDDTCISDPDDCAHALPECLVDRPKRISKNVTEKGEVCDEGGCGFTDGFFPWCWINGTAGDWGYCYRYSFCSPCTNHDQTCGFNYKWECQQDGANFGSKNTSKRGLPCLNFKDTHYAHKFGDSNICRATEHYAAWCFTKRLTSKDAGFQWDFCFPTCRLLTGRALTEARARLRVMTFNVWVSGSEVNDGPSKIAKHINHLNPDIVAVQEAKSKPEIFEKVLTNLGHNWTSTSFGHWSLAVIHRHQHLTDSVQFRDQSWKNHLTTVRVPTKSGDRQSWLDVHMWAVHLSPGRYGPYKACNGQSDLEIMEAEKYRAEEVKDLMDDQTFQRAVARSDEEPVIVAGDFNCPSPQDWTPAARHLHCQRHFNWPATKLLLDAGFKDAYRELHPDPVTDPATTWSPLYIKLRSGGPNTTELEPQDRIDFIFYKGEKLRAVQAEVYAGLEPIKTGNPPQDYKSNDWPSDHNAVFVDFDIVP